LVGLSGLGKVEVFPLEGLPEVGRGSDVAGLIIAALSRTRISLRDRDIVVVKQKIVSKAEGQVVRLSGVVPGRRAESLAKAEGKDPRLMELVLRESVRVVRRGHGVVITETKHGFVCANSGVDQSNVGRGYVSLLPVDSDLSARRIRKTLEDRTGRHLAVVVTDTFGRPWRMGQTDVAIGCSGIDSLVSFRGKVDRFGYGLRVTEPAVVDEVASAAELAMGKLDRVPAAVVRGVRYTRGEGGVKSLIMQRERDLFR
jgi:coenzyme F420-0:L-glutamate ligase/coenzyme F420-1:gamma-L-glutamate ligase